MCVRTRWWERFYPVSLSRVGVKVRHVFLAALTASSLNDWMRGTRHCLPNGLYGEEAFRCFLESESKRSKRSGHSYQILLVYRTNGQGAIVPMDPDIAKTVIAALSRSLRDTDYIGWYREGRVLGAGLTMLGRDSVVNGCNRLRTSLWEILQSELGLEESHRVQVRVCQPDEVKAVQLL